MKKNYNILGIKTALLIILILGISLVIMAFYIIYNNNSNTTCNKPLQPPPEGAPQNLRPKNTCEQQFTRPLNRSAALVRRPVVIDYNYRNQIPMTIYTQPLGPKTKIGYLVPKKIIDNSSPIDDFSIFNLYERKIDSSGYRFEYFIEFNGSTVFLIDPKNNKKCQKKDNPNGCYDFQDGDIVKLDINNNEYVVNRI
tara:strand:+ start:1339 stop:1926 length:588 start_codon:yes stop_codon:yes gene_type:complete